MKRVVVCRNYEFGGLHLFVFDMSPLKFLCLIVRSRYCPFFKNRFIAGSIVVDDLVCTVVVSRGRRLLEEDSRRLGSKVHSVDVTYTIYIKVKNAETGEYYQKDTIDLRAAEDFREFFDENFMTDQSAKGIVVFLDD